MGSIEDMNKVEVILSEEQLVDCDKDDINGMRLLTLANHLVITMMLRNVVAALLWWDALTSMMLGVRPPRMQAPSLV